MRLKIENKFKDVDTASISTAIANFVNSLNNVNYSSSGCFAMSTNAKYDGTFNAGIEYLKGKDIASMTDLCGSCNSQIIAKINEYKATYADYETAYSAYKTAYTTYTSNLNTWNEKQTGTKPTAPSADAIIDLENDLNSLVTDINNASF